MDQVITLLTNLFNLTKVASVTLPGLLAAGGLALILFPAVPIDVIPVVMAISGSSTSPLIENGPHPRLPAEQPSSKHRPVSTYPSAFEPACRLEHWSMDDVVTWISSLPGYNSGPVGQPAGIDLPSDALHQLSRIEQQADNKALPVSRRRRILEQFMLDIQARSLAQCIDIEKSWQGQEERDIQQLNSDVDNLEKQRTAAQDNFLAYQKSNSSLADRYSAAMDQAKARIDTVRNIIRGTNRDLQERARRIAELVTEQQVIKERLGDPGRLRPRLGFDAFMTGLVNHVVAFILLSLAAAIVVTAIDRAAFGAFFEDLFDGL